jgi:predicted porin
MKKSLIALAALAATSAFAQSSVTLYGRAEAGVDVGYNAKTTGTTNSFSVVGGTVQPGATNVASGTGTVKPGFRVQDGNNQGQGTSRLGFRGTEDLGGGLKANFVMEMGVRIDEGCVNGNGPVAAGAAPNTGACSSGNSGGGAAGNALFGRQAWVGASGGFGEVRLGRQVLGSFGVHANGLAMGAGSGLYEVGANIVQGGVRFSNAIQYRSPDFGGISGTISLAAPEGSVSSTTIAGANPDSAQTKNKTGVDLSLAYANGPIYVGFGYNRTGSSTATNNNEAGLLNIAGSTDTKVTDFSLSASYNFGVAQPFFSYVNRKNVASGSGNTVAGVAQVSGVLASLADSQNANGSGARAAAGNNAKSRQYSFGVKAPVGPVTLIAAYSNMKTTGSGSTSNAAGLISANDVEGKTRAFQIGALYPLSKRTTVQANYGVNNTKTSEQTRTGIVANGFNATGTTGEVKVRALNVGVSHLF